MKSFIQVDPLIAIVSPAFDELEARDKKNKRKRIILEHIARFIDAFLLKMKNNTFILLLYELYLKRLFSTINRAFLFTLYRYSVGVRG